MTRVRCSCGHIWETRKSLEEIEQLRCSECGTTSEDEISIASSESEADASPDSPILSEVKAEAGREDCVERVRSLLERVNQTAPQKSSDHVAREVRSEFRELQQLLNRLNDPDEPIQFGELQILEEYVDDLEARINEHADQLERIDHLDATVSGLKEMVSELTRERNQLQTAVDSLQEEHDQLRREIRQLEATVGELKEAKEEYRMGYADGMDQWKIEVPCAQCGDAMELRPGSEMHHAIIDHLTRTGWGHSTCQSPPETQQGAW